jgi:hypothetical protein
MAEQARPVDPIAVAAKAAAGARRRRRLTWSAAGLVAAAVGAAAVVTVVSGLPFPAGSLRVDAYTVTPGTQAEGGQSPDRFRVVAGRVADDVRRVEVDWATGERTDAQVANGFFVARVVAEPEPDPEGGVDAFDRPLRKLRTPPVTVTAYDADGRGAAVPGRYGLTCSPALGGVVKPLGRRGP